MDRIPKVIRSWRVRRGLPCGFHIWFDPTVEHVELLEGPVINSMELPEEDALVDPVPQLVLPWNGKLSMSGRGKREAVCSGLPEESSKVADRPEKIPF